ncbi:MAG: nitrile hydratase [Dehalococcoidia bacterium]
MPKVNDIGGKPNDDPIDASEHVLADWERRVDAMHSVLGQKGLRRTDELRRAIESLPPEQYESLTYYERWTTALEALLLEKGILTSEQIDQKMQEQA